MVEEEEEVDRGGRGCEAGKRKMRGQGNGQVRRGRGDGVQGLGVGSE